MEGAVRVSLMITYWNIGVDRLKDIWWRGCGESFALLVLGNKLLEV